MEIRTKVAERGIKNKWNWIKTPNVETYKKSYQRTPEKFVEENSSLYLISVNRKRLHSSFSAALKICGSAYALVLVMTNGETGKEFNRHLAVIQRHEFKSNGVEYIKHFEKIIKEFGIYVGEKRDEALVWTKGELPIQLANIKSIYRNQPDNFYILNGKVYWLRCIQTVVEEMYFKCISIAGGEYALAKALSTDETTFNKHYRSLQRMSFKQTRTFSTYGHLFANYLKRNRPLFEVDLDD